MIFTSTFNSYDEKVLKLKRKLVLLNKQCLSLDNDIKYEDVPKHYDFDQTKTPG